MKNNTSTNIHFLQGGGEMGELIRSHNWSKTSLGPPETWEQSLKSLVAVLLQSKFPMFLWWGPELICFYNDAYRPSLGNADKHPTILGTPAEKAWPETWSTIKPLIDRVLYHNESTWNEDQLIPIYRNGKMEDVYWTYSYSPAIGDDGRTAGVLVICTETTEKVKAARQLQHKSDELLASNQELAATNKTLLNAQKELQHLFGELEISEVKYRNQKHRLERFFMQIPAGICILDGPDFIFELVNPLYQELFFGRDLLGKPMLTALPELENGPIPGILKEVYRTGKTYEGKEIPLLMKKTADDSTENRYFDFIYQARLNAMNQVDGVLVFAIEVTEKILKEKKLRESLAKDAQLAAIVSSSEDSIVSKTLQGIITSWNSAAEKMFGYTAEEAVGRHISLLIPPSHLKEEDYIISQISRGNRVNHFETVRVAKDGRLIPLSLTISPIIDEHGRIIGASKIARDISSQKEAQETAKRLYQQVKELNDKKDEFIGLASHELKTPLASIGGYLQILSRTHADPASKRFVDKAIQQLKKLTALVNDLLDISKIEAGKLQFAMKPFDLKSLVEDVIELMQHSAGNYTISLNSKVSNCVIVADSQRIEQVLVNLLSNAIKYSPGADRIDVGLCRNEKEAIVSVRDYGLGIAPDKLEHIFARFYRVDDTSPNISGLGIGLYLSQEIVQRHQGRLWVESEPGRGSVFYFTLPAQQ